MPLNIFKGFFGICEASGHLDFYPEGGRAIQPGCQFNPICSHSRATYLYIASLNLLHNCRVIGVECKDMRSFSDVRMYCYQIFVMKLFHYFITLLKFFLRAYAEVVDQTDQNVQVWDHWLLIIQLEGKIA